MSAWLKQAMTPPSAGSGGTYARHAVPSFATDRGAVLLAGQSGNGKSTLLGVMLARGYTMLADDLAAITLDGAGKPMVQPGFPQIKLWADAAQRLGRATDDLHRVRPQIDKFAVPTSSRFAATPLPLSAIYMLYTHNESDIRLEVLADSDGFHAIRDHTFGWRYVAGLGTRLAHFRMAVAVANTTPVVRVTRPRHPYLLDELADCIEEHLA